jgi:zona occludens toxin (predicted ATPase)
MKAGTFVILILSVILFIAIGAMIITILGTGLRIEQMKNEMRTDKDKIAVLKKDVENRDDILKKIKTQNQLRNWKEIDNQIKIWEALK